MPSKADLERQVKKIFGSTWKERDGKAVPDFKDLSADNDAVKLNGTVLYADMADSTDLVDRYERPFAAKIYKAYLRCAATIINNEQGTITAYDGDRVMAVFRGNTKETSAVRSALMINYAVHEIINPLMKKQYPNTRYQLKHVVGIDTSTLFVTRTGVRKDSDLVWVGRAANYAAKLCSLDGENSIYITRTVFSSMDRCVKYDYDKNDLLMWRKEHCTARNGMRIYSSNSQWPID